MSAGASIAARVAGAIGALGYLSGMVDGPIVGAVAGLALITFGRSAVSRKGFELLGPASFGVLAGAAGAVALRWGTLDLPEIRGAQGVLGPTIAVEPAAVAIVSVAALVAASLATGLWLGAPEQAGTFPSRWWWVEALAGALFLSSLFAGPSPTGVTQAGIWVGATVAVGGVAVATARLTDPWSVRARYLLLGSCGFVVPIAAGVAGSYA